MSDELNNSGVLDVNEARALYENEGLRGFVEFIDFVVEKLEQGTSIYRFGMFLDPLGVTQGPFSLEAVRLLKQININNPLETLTSFANRISEINPEVLNIVNRGLHGCVSAMRNIEAGDFDEIMEFDDEFDDLSEDRWNNEGGNPGRFRRLH